MQNATNQFAQGLAGWAAVWYNKNKKEWGKEKMRKKAILLVGIVLLILLAAAWLYGLSLIHI